MLRSRYALPLVLLLLGALLFLPGCTYIAKQARGQLSLLAGRVPNDRALETIDFDDEEREMLLWVPVIKAFGETEIGLSPTKNYETINPDFDSVVWNVSAAAPDAFTSHRYKYPIVGELPYIGFFDKEDALAEQARLDELGWETWVRGAGAYSTLGWFKDPLWRSMLKWDLNQMSNTVLHELCHSTLWLGGQGKFNESFASFVGDEASRRFLESIADEQPEVWQTLLDREVDGAQYRAFMHAMVTKLKGLYRSGLSRSEIVARREALVEESRAEYAKLEFRLDGYSRAMNPNRTMNNARLKQFRVYNTGMNDFDEALARFDGDLRQFVETAGSELTRRRRKEGRRFDPYQALRELNPPE